jgi:hypothetical protein
MGKGDLENFEGLFPVFRPPAGFWSDLNFWAPEVHHYRDEWYMFATFKPTQGRRGTAILKSTGGKEGLYGPFVPWSEGPVTPPEWECLDGTLYVDRGQKPWMVFCHEWYQAGDGEIRAMLLADNLKSSAGKAALLFRTSEAAWTHPLPFVTSLFSKRNTRNYVTKAPGRRIQSPSLPLTEATGCCSVPMRKSCSWRFTCRTAPPKNALCSSPLKNGMAGCG